MNRKKMTMIAVFLLGLSMSQVAWAHWRSHGWHGDVGIFIGPSLGWRYYPPAYYYPPPVYVSPPQPPVYMEQPQAAPPQAYWYYCTNPEGYYPTVQECPGGWLKVLPQTQPAP